MTKYIRIDYVVKPDVDLDELKGAIADFVAGIRAHHPEHRYTSYQHPSDPLRFIHIGEVVEEVLPDLQKQPFFLRVTAAGGNVTTYPRRPLDRNRECSFKFSSSRRGISWKRKDISIYCSC